MIKKIYKMIYPPCALALCVHVAVVLGDLRPGPVRHAPRPRRVLRVTPGASGEWGFAVKLRSASREVDSGLANRSCEMQIKLRKFARILPQIIFSSWFWSSEWFCWFGADRFSADGSWRPQHSDEDIPLVRLEHLLVLADVPDLEEEFSTKEYFIP